MSPQIRLVGLPPEAQASPIFVSRHELTTHRIPEGTAPRATTFFNHDHSVILLHEGPPTVVEHLVGTDHTSTAWTLNPGDVLILPAGAPHRRQEHSRGPFTAAAFCAACLDLDDQVIAPLDRVRTGASPVVAIAEDRRPHVAHLFAELLSATTPPTAPLIVQKSLLTLLLHELSRSQHQLSRGGDTLVADALRFIERHCLKPLSLAEVAAHLQRTPSHVATLVKKATGQTVLGWITMHRMAEARRRLRHSDEQVEIIAERVGYADPTHFIRVFRRHHGLTPAAWRRHHA
jgi:AraC-like DNA-binding protein